MNRKISVVFNKYALLISLFLILQLLANTVTTSLFSLAEIHSPAITDVCIWFSNLIAYFLSLLIPFGLYSLVSGKKYFSRWSFDGDFNFNYILFGFGTVFAGIVVSLIMNIILLVLGIEPETLPMPESNAGIFIFILNSVILAPVLEEIVFREIILKDFLPYGKATAIMASAVLFAVSHFSWRGFVPIFVMGIVLAVSAVYTGSLKMAIFAHALNNLMSVIMTYTDNYFETLFITLIFGIWAFSTFVKNRRLLLFGKADYSFLLSFGTVLLIILFVTVQII